MKKVKIPNLKAINTFKKIIEDNFPNLKKEMPMNT